MDKPLIQQDEQYRRAVAIVMEAGRASVSMVQRKLNIRYSDAQDLIVRMLRDGLVGVEDTPGVPTDVAWAAAMIEELERLARAATPGPWKCEQNTVYVLHGEPARNRFSALVQAGRRDDAGPDELAANAAYIAACSPDRVLRLLEVVKAANAAMPCFEEYAPIIEEIAALRAALAGLEEGQ